MTNNPFIPLDKQRIEEQLMQGGYSAPIQLACFAELPSTNSYLKTHATTNSICIAECQTAGRGRFGRHWSSPYGENIYLSLRWTYQGALANLSGLSLVVALTLQQLVRDSMTRSCQIKWPNDIIYEQKKMAGILVELNSDTQDHIQTVIGIGLNVNTDTSKTPLSDQRHCSLFDVTGKQFDRNSIIVNLLLKLDKDLRFFSEQGFAAFHTRWAACDYLLHQLVCINSAGKILKGIASGVNEQGLLMLKTEDGRMHALSSGEFELHHRAR